MDITVHIETVLRMTDLGALFFTYGAPSFKLFFFSLKSCVTSIIYESVWDGDYVSFDSNRT